MRFFKKIEVTKEINNIIKCENCAFWVKSDETWRLGGCDGECHRNPPVLLVADVLTDIALNDFGFPRTDATEWCGEFKNKKD